MNLTQRQVSMADKPTTFREWIAAKGVGAIAAAVPSRQVETVYMWRSRGLIPRVVWVDILMAFPELNVRVLLDMEAASLAQRANV
jgi:hypothetical protein